MQILKPCSLNFVIGWIFLAASIMSLDIDAYSRSTSFKQGVSISKPSSPLERVSSGSAPEYALCGRAPELAQIVLAKTPSSTITALDLLMFDGMHDRIFESIPIDVWLDPARLSALPQVDAIKTMLKRMIVYEALAQTVKDWVPSTQTLRVQSFGAAAAYWIERYVKPQIVVEDLDIERFYIAHPDLYQRRQRAQVRYIFMKADLLNVTSMEQATNAMAQLEQRIRSGELTFSDAASQYSQAPSAKDGGLTPPFYNGERFVEFENNTFLLTEPGQISPVFTGPGGVYLVQLAQRLPLHDIPLDEVYDSIKHRLEFEHVRYYYYYLVKKIASEQFVMNNASMWGSIDLQAPLAQLDEATLSRPLFLSTFSNPVDSQYYLRMPIIERSVNFWIEGETVMQQLEGQQDTMSPWIKRAQDLAEAELKAQRACDMMIPQSVYASPQAAETLLTQESQNEPHLLRETRMIRFELTIDKVAQLSDSELHSAKELLRQFSRELMNESLPSDATPLDLVEWTRSLKASAEGLDSAIISLRHVVAATLWPNIKIEVVDEGWQPSYSTSAWRSSLEEVDVGRVSQGRWISETQINHYMALAERPLDLKMWAQKPLFLQTLAYQLKVRGIQRETLQRLENEGSVQIVF